ncbi:MAG TPA: YlxR family protein [Dehalococcoidia bacterium]|nr:YlxR family protein [Dehalococcoidia bacterium]
MTAQTPTPNAKKPTRRQPTRTCVACRTATEKRALLRVVREPSGEVRIDASGKAAGRGAYVGEFRSCWTRALQGTRLGQALRTTISEHDRDQLSAFAETLPDRPCPNQERATR